MLDIKFPDLRSTEDVNGKLGLLEDYLFQLHEQLQHELTHISKENFTGKALEELKEAITDASA